MSPRRPLRTLTAAIALPAALIAGWLALVLAPWPPPPETAALRARVRAEAPATLVLGNSITRLGVAPARLGPSTTVLAPDEATSADWYAILRHHVLAQGVAPRRVVIVTLPSFAVDVRPRSGAARDRLSALLTSDDVDVRAKVAGRPPGPWLLERLTLGRAQLRDALVAAVERGLAGGAAAREAAARRYEALDPGRHAAVLPVASPTPGPRRADPARSLMPELLDLCAEHGAELWFVHAPVRAVPPEERLPGGADALARLMTSHPAGRWLDLSTLDLPDALWTDDTHLTAAGARLLSDALAARLEDPTLPVGRLAVGTLAPVPGPQATLAVSEEPAGPGRTLLRAAAAGALSDVARVGRYPARPCAPLTVLADGAPVPPAPTPASLRPGRPGWVATPEGVLTTATGALTVRLDPTRPCDAGAWLVPGGAVTVHLPPGSGAPLRWLELEAWSPTPATVRVSLPGHLEADVALDGPARVPLATPVPPGRPVTATLSLVGEGAALIEAALLRELER